MSDDSIQKREAIFNSAAEIDDPAERAAFLDRECGGDAELRAEIQDLLGHDAAAGSFLESPPGELLGADKPPQPAPTLDSDANQPSPATATPETGGTLRYFGDYELLEEIARGGMGVVYKARQVNLNRVVALKMILAGQLAGEQDVQRFHAEAEAAANLDHPNIVPIFEVGEHEGQHFYSMGYVEGDSLADRIADGPLPPDEAAELVQTIATAIHYAHEKGVIHRDLKPANVLLEAQNLPKITDFGLAKKLEDDSGLTATGQILGTPAFMPPEQAAGKTAEVTEAADVYSLGAILYCLLVGHPPFQAANVIETIQQVLHQDSVPLRRLNERIPLDLETTCLKCLDKSPARRYASAQDLADELARFLRGEPILARRVGAVERSWKWARRHPALATVWVLLPLVLLLGSIGTGAFWLWRNSETARVQLAVAKKRTDNALSREQVAKGKAEDALQREAAANAMLTNQKQYVDHLLYARQVAAAMAELREDEVARARAILEDCDPARRNWEWYHVWRRCHESLHEWKSEDGRSIRTVAYAPDGRHIAVVDQNARGDADTMVRIWNVNTGAMRTLAESDAVVSQVRFNLDGKLLAGACEFKHHVTIWEIETGKELHRLARGNVQSLAFRGRAGITDRISGFTLAESDSSIRRGNRCAGSGLR